MIFAPNSGYIARYSVPLWVCTLVIRTGKYFAYVSDNKHGRRNRRNENSEAICKSGIDLCGYCHFSDHNTGKILIVYQLGLNISGAAFLVRGLLQVWGTQLSRGQDVSVSGIAGIGHILTGVSIICLLWKIRQRAE